METDITKFEKYLNIDCPISVKRPDEGISNYTLVSTSGKGKHGITWKAKTYFGEDVAIKFVHLDSYKDHSIDTEIRSVIGLSDRFAKIREYGTPLINNSYSQDGIYAIVIDWIQGETLFEYLDNSNNEIGVAEFLRIAYALCEALAILQNKELCHNDLHEKNIIVTKSQYGPSLSEEVSIRIIDTGSLKSNKLRESLCASWSAELEILRKIINRNDEIEGEICRISSWLSWFSRRDEEWVVSHLCKIINKVRRIEYKLDYKSRAFFFNISELLKKMIDQDRTMRIDDPQKMYEFIENLWNSSAAPEPEDLYHPFDLTSAELVRSDAKLNRMFSEECSWFQRCDSSDPVYIYGPRGCGKSTILRILSLKATLQSDNAKQLFDNRPFIGVYISCTAELRSRFMLFRNNEIACIEKSVLTYFQMMLIEALLETLTLLQDGIVEKYLHTRVGLSPDIARNICVMLFNRLEIDDTHLKLQGISWIEYARKKIGIKKDRVWSEIVKGRCNYYLNPSVIFDVCSDLESILPLFREKCFAFLIDDYSNQRIPYELQKILNTAISFAKQGNPIFKVSSEYQGLNLDDIQQGREVHQINIGEDYIKLTEEKRSVFLEDVINIRFRLAKKENISAEKLLGKSKIFSGVPMARAIRAADKSISGANESEKFYYHGIDTIADICSGDVAMALDLVSRIWERGGKDGFPIKKSIQHEEIRKYSESEHQYIRFQSEHGHEMSNIVDKICWLASQCAIHNTSTKNGISEPMVKTHLEIKGAALNDLDRYNEKYSKIFSFMYQKGILFKLGTTKSRHEDKTEAIRFQIRRILLAKYNTPLGRKDPIKIDDYQRLLSLLTNPETFAKAEIGSNYNQLNLEV